MGDGLGVEVGCGIGVGLSSAACDCDSAAGCEVGLAGTTATSGLLHAMTAAAKHPAPMTTDITVATDFEIRCGKRCWGEFITNPCYQGCAPRVGCVAKRQDRCRERGDYFGLEDAMAYRGGDSIAEPSCMSSGISSSAL